MSLKNADQFLLDCYQNANEELKDILKNIDSKFESKEAKFHYVSEKAKQLGYDFTPKEIANSFKNSKKMISKNKKSEDLPDNIKNTKSIDKKFWDSLW